MPQFKNKHMPVNKNAFIRLKIIHDLMKERQKGWTIPTLTAEINKRLDLRHHLPPISTRTIGYDLFDLEVDFNAPIQSEKIGRYTYYSYSDQDFQLLDEETRALQERIAVLEEEKSILEKERNEWKKKYLGIGY